MDEHSFKYVLISMWVRYQNLQTGLLNVKSASLSMNNCTCSAYASSMEALKQPTIRVVAIIAEGVPEGDAKKLISYARANNKVKRNSSCIT